MKFLKFKVQRYHEKKLLEAQQKLKFHTEIKNQLDSQLKQAIYDEQFEIRKNIEKQLEFMEIWKKNILEIKQQLKKLKS